MNCRVCWEGADVAGLYQLPCRCQGSLALVHDSCFCRFMAWRYERTRDVSCDVCRTRFMYTTEGETDLTLHCQFFQLLYRTLSVFLYYLLFLTGVFIHWLVHKPLPPRDAQGSQSVYAMAVFACLQPSIVICVYILVALHRTVISPPSLHSLLTDYLHQHATRLT